MGRAGSVGGSWGVSRNASFAIQKLLFLWFEPRALTSRREESGSSLSAIIFLQLQFQHRETVLIKEAKNDSHGAMFSRRICHLQEDTELVFANVEIANTPASSMSEITVGNHFTV